MSRKWWEWSLEGWWSRGSGGSDVGGPRVVV